ncbi:MAG: hypothetical protein HKN26_14215, partial [Acidimicrobiales bacterium]|nr:hypothetical protein [Acidimicrobiales bacterium]
MGVEPASHLDALTRASAAFGEVVDRVGDDQWEVAIPGFHEWTVLTAVAHVVIGAAHATAMLKGEDATPLLT